LSEEHQGRILMKWVQSTIESRREIKKKSMRGIARGMRNHGVLALGLEDDEADRSGKKI